MSATVMADADMIFVSDLLFCDSSEDLFRCLHASQQWIRKTHELCSMLNGQPCHSDRTKQTFIFAKYSFYSNPVTAGMATVSQFTVKINVGIIVNLKWSTGVEIGVRESEKRSLFALSFGKKNDVLILGMFFVQFKNTFN